MKAPRTSFFMSVIFIACMRSSSAADPLEQWGQRTAPGTGYGLNAIAFGNGVFVAVGGNGTMLVSVDGANWTNSSPGNYGELRNVHFLNGEFNVVGDTNRLLRSSNGINWTEWVLPAGNYLDVGFGNGTYVVAGTTTYASTDSLTWVFGSPRIVTDFNTTVRYVNLENLAFGAGEFVARRSGPQGYPEGQGMFHATNGTNWVRTSGGPYPEAGSLGLFQSDMTYVNGLFLVASTQPGGIFSSSNGVSWNGGSVPGNFPSAIAYGANYFVTAARDNGVNTTLFSSSTNATAWQQVFTAPNSFAPRGVAFGNDTFVVVGVNGSNPAIYQSGNLGGAPAILTEPLDRAAVVNNPASFSVVASGSIPLSYQWQKGGSSITNATNATFTISNVVATDSGGYRVIVTNSFGSVTSRVAQLSVSFLQIHEYAGITIFGVVGKTYRIEASPQAGGSWTTLTNVVLPQSPFIWIDYDSPNAGTRVYRAAELP